MHDHANHSADVGRAPNARLGRATQAVVGAALLLVCVLAAVIALSALLLLLGQGASSSAVVGPVQALLNILGATFTLILVGIGIRYAYYYWCWLVSRHWFGKPRHRISFAGIDADSIPFLKFQVTTKGGALPVVERSLRVLESVCDNHPWLRAKVCAEVITEREDEVAHLRRAFRGSSLELIAIALPADYETPNGSRLKARALHHMVELRRNGFNARAGRVFIVHFDEETVMAEPHVMMLLDYLCRDPRPISQGPILYPLEWEQAPWVCRAIESTRPFGCSECARVMQNPPPPHLHGSNLVVDEAVENQVGWDFGTLDGQPFVAEDLLFGLRAYALLGRDIFGWHGATALEQPPLSLFWAVQQRLRWVLGALQGLRAMWVQSDYAQMPKRQKLRLSLSVYSRIATYGLGFPIGMVGLLFILHPLDEPGLGSPFGLLRIALLLSALGWIASYQIGVRRNLLYQSLPRRQQLQQHLMMLVATPFVGLCETVGPFLAVVRWLLGARRAAWTPTPKLADRPAAAGASAPVPVVTTLEQLALPLTVFEPAPMPAWLVALQTPLPEAPPTPAAPLAPAPAPARETMQRRRPPRAPLPRTPLLNAARVLTALGVVVAMFMAYEFALSGVFYQQSQRSLLAGFKEAVPAGATSSASEGSPVALLRIPSLGVDQVVVEGSSPEDLKDGPGHLRGSSLPGEYGNAVIIGRRTTYGAPFRDIDRLARGDRITVITGQGPFTYVVNYLQRTGPGEADPLDDSSDSRLTLVTSDPAYVPDGRLAIVAKLQGAPVGVPTRSRAPVNASDLGLAGDSLGLGLALFWGLVLAGAIWVLWRGARPWPARLRHLLATPLLTALALLVFASIDRLLPGSM